MGLQGGWRRRIQKAHGRQTILPLKEEGLVREAKSGILRGILILFLGHLSEFGLHREDNPAYEL